VKPTEKRDGLQQLQERVEVALSELCAMDAHIADVVYHGRTRAELRNWVARVRATLKGGKGAAEVEI